MKDSLPLHPLHRTGKRRLRRLLQARARRTLYAGVMLSTATVGVPGASLDAAVNRSPG